MALALIAPAAAQASCVGDFGCPYTSVTSFPVTVSTQLNGLAVDRAGNVYSVDFITGTVYVYSSAGALVRQFSTPGANPVDLAVNQAGTRLYVLNRSSSNVTVFDGAGKLVDTFGGQGSDPGELNQPLSIALDPQGNVYVADSSNDRVQKFRANGTFLAQSSSQFDAPLALVVGAFQTLYVAQFDGVLRAPELAFLDTSTLKQGATVPLPAAGLVQDITVTQIDDVFVSNQLTAAIEEYEASGVLYTYWGGQGTNLGQFGAITGIAASGSNRVLALDIGNQRVQVFTLAVSARARPTAAASRVTAAGVAPVTLACLTRGVAACTGSVQLAAGGRAVTRSYSLRAGRRAVVRLRLPARVARTVRRRGRLGARLTVVTRRPGGRPRIHRSAHSLRAR